jgi:hypothetical protein
VGFRIYDLLTVYARGAAIAMGRDPEVLAKCLDATTRRSLQHIYRHDFERFTSTGKTSSRRTEKLKYDRPSPKLDKAIEAYYAALDAAIELFVCEFCERI